jgi:hypothetical protein
MPERCRRPIRRFRFSPRRQGRREGDIPQHRLQAGRQHPRRRRCCDRHRQPRISPGQSPCPATPTPTRTPDVMALGWVPHRSRPPSSDLPRGQRGNQRGPSTLHAAHATEEMVLNISKRPPPPGIAPPSPRRGRRLRCPSPHWEESWSTTP